MKKIIYLFLFSALFFNVKYASAQGQYDKGNILVNGGFGLGYYYSSGGIPILVSGEYAITDAISVGPYLGYTSRTFTEYTWKERYTFIDFGARGSYHFMKHLNLDIDKLDLYGGLFVGYLAANYKLVNAPVGYNAYYYNTGTYGSVARVGIYAGARYYFTDMFAAYAELGYGIAPLSLGVTLKF